MKNINFEEKFSQNVFNDNINAVAMIENLKKITSSLFSDSYDSAISTTDLTYNNDFEDFNNPHLSELTDDSELELSHNAKEIALEKIELAREILDNKEKEIKNDY